MAADQPSPLPASLLVADAIETAIQHGCPGDFIAGLVCAYVAIVGAESSVAAYLMSTFELAAHNNANTEQRG